MHLRFMLTLFTLLFFSDNADAGGSGDGEHGGNDEGAGSDGNDAAAGLKSALDKERARAKQAEKDLRSANARLSEIESKDKGDVERLTGERDTAATRAETAESKLREATASVAVFDAATKANARDARAMYRIVRDDLEFDDDGPTNVDAVITQAKKDFPTLFQAAGGSGDGGAGTTKTEREIQPGLDRLTHAYETQSKSATRRR